MTTWITICDTCKRDDWQAGDTLTDGEKLASLVETAAKGRDVQTRRVSCLMGCKRSCNISVQAHGKVNYTLGEFKPTDADATAIVDYAEKHAQSDTGVVPYREWPDGVKGHFVTRHHPLPE